MPDPPMPWNPAAVSRSVAGVASSQLPDDALDKVLIFCSAKMPHDLADKSYLEVTTTDSTLSIHECRLLLQGLPNQWTKTPVAQLRREGDGWTLYFGDRYGGWTHYDDLDPAQSVDAVIAELEADPTSVFWG